MAENGTLTAGQRRFVVSLLDVRTIREAAVKARIGERTAWRYLSEGAVKAAIARRQDAILAQVTGGIVADMSEARQVLVDVMRSLTAKDSDRIRAAGLILDCGLKLFELLTLADRVTALEQKHIGGAT